MSEYMMNDVLYFRYESKWVLMMMIHVRSQDSGGEGQLSCTPL